MVGMEVIMVWWGFVIPQNDFFSLILFSSVKLRFYFAMLHLFLLWIRTAFKIGFFTSYLIYFLRDFVPLIYVEDLGCFFFSIQLRMAVCSVRLFFFVANDFSFISEDNWYLGLNFTIIKFLWFSLSRMFSVEFIILFKHRNNLFTFVSVMFQV